MSVENSRSADTRNDNTNDGQKHLILGGARSGKSAYAEALALDCASNQNLQAVYIATATAGDEEMIKRIARHQSDRADQWQLIEEPFNIADVLDGIKQPSIVLIDCLTLWLNNGLIESPEHWQSQKLRFLESLANSKHPVVLVSNEVGHGITPMGELSRRFVDEIGWLHQDLARQCDQVTMIIAGLPQKLK